MKVSILTACHNDQKFILECSKSILSQDYSDLEWIVVDDCSSDRTHELLKKVNDPRLKLFKNDKQLFCSSTYAKALKKATGDICCIVDGDDALVQGAVSTIVKLYKKYGDIGYIYTQHWWCDIQLKPQRRGLSSLPKNGLSMSRASLEKNAHSFSHWRTFRYHLSTQAEIFPEGLKCSVDKYMGFVLERIAYGGFYAEPLYFYRYYKENMSLTCAKDQKSTWKKMAKKFQRDNPNTLAVRRVK